ncbi:hypothetical protein [Salibacterium halotolerans]|uniref:Uncharacterized protein n=1 Tax=Salibacterium halotolerans TaxID=1884432 RepID=A0A1I5XL33_9BACI|nr:hypothetical protein [Salibacterium halotolerans]SFQ32703.1 hypothetical protein SAMN05518683_12920 [Salibacterium halotolerans]
MNTENKGAASDQSVDSRALIFCIFFETKETKSGSFVIVELSNKKEMNKASLEHSIMTRERMTITLNTKHKQKLIKFSLIVLASAPFVLIASCANFDNGELIAESSTHGAEDAEYYPVFHQNDFENRWNQFDFRNTASNVDWEEYAVIFIATIESKNCTKEIENIESNPDDNVIDITLEENNTPCLEMGIPKTFVIKLDREMVKNMEKVQINSADVKLGNVHRRDPAVSSINALSSHKKDPIIHAG